MAQPPNWQKPRRYGGGERGDYTGRGPKSYRVAERHMKRLAEDCVESVSGVSQVHNRLRVEPSSAQRSQGSQSQQGEGSLGSVHQSSGRTV